jgi:YD repeat-containing protein
VKQESRLDNSVTVTRSYEYDLLGHLTKSTDRLGRVVDYTNDLLGRNTYEKWSTTASSTVTGQYYYQYDVASRLTNAEGKDPRTGGPLYSNDAFTYFDTDWLKSETMTNGTPLQTTLTTGYDLAGQRTSLKADYATGSGFGTVTHDFADTFAYDAKGRMTSLGRGSQGTGTGYNSVANKYVTFGYNDFDEITSIDRYASNTNTNLVAHTDYGYDYLGRLTKIDHQKGATHLAKYDVVYDSHARISTITDTYNNTAFNDLRTYSYDDTEQLGCRSWSQLKFRACLFLSAQIFPADGDWDYIGAASCCIDLQQRIG